MTDHLRYVNFEFNTVLSNIHLALDLLQSEDNNPDHDSLFQIIRNNLARLRETIPSVSKTLSESKQN